ncbi:Sugar transporter ERD6 [Camponotus floridanus]|uniref:Sugar transporter ERD6 n=1 Tax=Camponotus floridanus TaxID=104421 RepID=E2AR86_CAMFO|nr:Sugar transporter ERD6 [Camponotus floridanus]
MLSVAGNIGMLVEFGTGPFLSVQNLTFVSLIAPCLFMLIFIWLPESPYYLMRRNAKEETINSLVQLRGKEDVYNDAYEIEEFVKANLDDQTGFRELLCVPGNRRTLIIMLCLSITQKMSGYQAILNYAQIIFDQMNVNLEGKYLTMILGVVQLIFTIICMFITDHSGRRSLLIISCIGSACSTAMVATYFSLQYNHINTKDITWLPATGNLGMLSVGQFLGWSSPPLATLMQGKDEKYPMHLIPEEASWVASLLTLGSVAGAIICAVIVNIFGRKNTMLFIAVPSIISWLMIAFATSSTVTGLAMGIAYTATPMYLGEISPAYIRGNLTSMLTVAKKIGILVKFVIGPFLSTQNLTFLSLVAPCIFILVFIWLPESPYYLMHRNAKQEAINSLIQLRGKEDVYNEAYEIEQ